MAGPTRISELSDGSPVQPTDQVPVARGSGATGYTYKVNAGRIVSDLFNVGNSSTVDLTFDTSTRTLSADVSTAVKEASAFNVFDSPTIDLDWNASTRTLSANFLGTLGGGTVTNVTGTAPIAVANGTTTPSISIAAATTSAAGSMSSADKIKLDNIVEVPVGSVMAFPSTTAPSGWIKLNGASLSRSTYSNLWTFAQASGNLVTDTAWYSTSATGSFSQGDGSTTFRLPDFRGEFVRGWDDSRGIDAGRGIGVWQKPSLQVYDGDSTNYDPVGLHVPNSSATLDGAFGLDPIDPSWYTLNRARYHVVGLANSVAVNWGGAVRPRNIPLLYCIKF